MHTVSFCSLSFRCFIFSGLAHITYSRKNVAAREQPPDVNCWCNCYTAFTEEKKKSIVENFCALEDHTLQNTYVCDCVANTLVNEIRRRPRTKASTANQRASSLGVSVKSVHLVAGRLGFYSQSGHTKDFKSSIRSFRARRSAQAEVRRVLCMCCSSFVIENCNGPTIENGLNNVCLHPLSRTFTFYLYTNQPITNPSCGRTYSSKFTRQQQHVQFYFLHLVQKNFGFCMYTEYRILYLVSCKTNLDLLLMCYWYALMAETALPVHCNKKIEQR